MAESGLTEDFCSADRLSQIPGSSVLPKLTPSRIPRHSPKSRQYVDPTYKTVYFDALLQGSGYHSMAGIDPNRETND
jgi:hypothetical protein